MPALRTHIACGAVAMLTMGLAPARAPSVAGNVADAVGQPLPGVSVTILPASGGTTRHAKTASTGAYRFDGLEPGTYRVDFAVAGFDVIRRNNVRVGPAADVDVDAVLAVSSICECVEVVPAEPLRLCAGQVVDDSGRPLPRARLDVVSPNRREVRYAGQDGRFLVRLPLRGTWPLTASDSGFRPATLHVSATADALVIRLSHDAAAAVSDTEQLSRGCRCPGDLFSHQGR